MSQQGGTSPQYVQVCGEFKSSSRQIRTGIARVTLTRTSEGARQLRLSSQLMKEARGGVTTWKGGGGGGRQHESKPR